jgi:hypothetical protein
VVPPEELRIHPCSYCAIAGCDSSSELTATAEAATKGEPKASRFADPPSLLNEFRATPPVCLFRIAMMFLSTPKTSAQLRVVSCKTVSNGQNAGDSEIWKWADVRYDGIPLNGSINSYSDQRSYANLSITKVQIIEVVGNAFLAKNRIMQVRIRTALQHRYRTAQI